MAFILWVILTLLTVYARVKNALTCPKMRICGDKATITREEEKDHRDGQISEQELLTASYKHPTILRAIRV